MNVLELREKISNYRTEKQSFLDDTYMWVKMSRDAIASLSEKEIVFKVPDTNGKDKEIQREDKEKLINRITNGDIFNSAYVIMISAVEDYFNKIMKLLLLYDPSRIKVTISNTSMQTNIEIIDFINKTKEEMTNEIIEQRIENLFYASPSKQLEYMDKALGISIGKKEWFEWIEYKARRDVIIHNNNKINDIYCSKVNGYGKFTIGEYVTFNEMEFSSIVADFKNIIGKIDFLIRKEYHIPSEKEVKDFISEDEMKNLDEIAKELEKI